ncbi:MlaD family protein [Acidiferrimicrobium sp. IK]|uniref:MlaD family protein n=1 Tax=Acidiferrimicrobium sp. IK TaxID=2871700 RepID=UPI0021CB3F86|nr:MlaD family protein [Acidiferrimicrobium sp. IK]MCU4184403.1 MlaD family protein [Acidiferrimicrobium sp. IK]
MAATLSAPRRGIGYAATIAIVVALVAGVVVWRAASGGGYHVTIVFPEATDLHNGSLVQVQGFSVGKVSHLGVSNGQAMVTVSLDSADTPLHSGTTAKIDYKALLGERYVELAPAPKSNPVVPNGGILPGGEDRVELAQVLSALDPQTRQRLADGIPQLAQTLGNTTNVNQTVQAAAPSVQALAQVLDAVGQNGLALRQLVSSMADLSKRLVNRQNSLVSTVSGLTTATGNISQQDANLTTGLQGLPSTLTAADTTLGKLPATTAAVVPLLNDLAPGAATLPAFASKLRPVIDQLSPVVAQLQPTLASLNVLLADTPGLVNSANATVPGLTQATSALVAPQQLTVPVADANGNIPLNGAGYPTGQTTQITSSVLDFARPYTPELAGFFANWGSWLASYDGNGHLGPFTSVLGASALAGEVAGVNGYSTPATTALGVVPLPATATNGPPFPGTVAGQPCTTCSTSTDAAGNPIK